MRNLTSLDPRITWLHSGAIAASVYRSGSPPEGNKSSCISLPPKPGLYEAWLGQSGIVISWGVGTTDCCVASEHWGSGAAASRVEPSCFSCYVGYNGITLSIF